MLKRKMKGVAMDQPPYGASEDAKSRFRHQVLLQDFHDLKKETDDRRNHLEKMKLKKLVLSAEVQFLRRRYQHLLNNQPLRPPPLLQETRLPPKKQKKSDASVRRNKIDKNVGGKQAASRQPIPNFSSGQKQRNYSGKKAASWQPGLGFDLNHNEINYSTKDAAVLLPPAHGGKEVVGKNSSPVLDLTQKEDRAYSGKEAASSNPITAFDLNQISREDEEFQCDPNPMIRVGNDEPQLLDVKSSACRNSGNTSSRARKRKISWQDQMALRV